MKQVNYVFHYTVTDETTNEEIYDKMISTPDPEVILQGINIFTKEHPNYDWEDATRITKQVVPTIEDAFVSYDNGKVYWLIIHKLEKDAAEAE